MIRLRIDDCGLKNGIVTNPKSAIRNNSFAEDTSL